MFFNVFCMVCVDFLCRFHVSHHVLGLYHVLRCSAVSTNLVFGAIFLAGGIAVAFCINVVIPAPGFRGIF